MTGTIFHTFSMVNNEITSRSYVKINKSKMCFFNIQIFFSFYYSILKQTPLRETVEHIGFSWIVAQY